MHDVGLDALGGAVGLIMGTLGLAHLESDNPAGAIPWLEQAVPQAGRFTNRQIEGRFLVFLAKAYLLLGRLDEARRAAARSLERCPRSASPTA